MDESTNIYIYIVSVNLVSNLSNTNGRMATSPQVELKTMYSFQHSSSLHIDCQ